jgi:hypothetical protein
MAEKNMQMQKIAWADFASELCGELIAAVEVEELARATGLNPNTIYCFSYKTKAQVPNLAQFGMMLERVDEVNPAAVVKVIKRLAARFGVFAESLERLGNQVAGNKV